MHSAAGEVRPPDAQDTQTVYAFRTGVADVEASCDPHRESHLHSSIRNIIARWALDLNSTGLPALRIAHDCTVLQALLSAGASSVGKTECGHGSFRRRVPVSASLGYEFTMHKTIAAVFCAGLETSLKTVLVYRRNASCLFGRLPPSVRPRTMDDGLYQTAVLSSSTSAGRGGTARTIVDAGFCLRRSDQLNDSERRPFLLFSPKMPLHITMMIPARLSGAV